MYVVCNVKVVGYRFIEYDTIFRVFSLGCVPETQPAGDSTSNGFSQVVHHGQWEHSGCFHKLWDPPFS